MRTLLAVLAVLAFPFAGTMAQSAPRDCNLARPAYDNPFSDARGWTMRRYQWHGFYAGLSTLTAYGIHKTTKLPGWASATIATVGLGLIPHIRGSLVKHQYKMDTRDWAFDLFNRGAPAMLIVGRPGKTWQSNTIAAAGFAAGYLTLACYASP